MRLRVFSHTQASGPRGRCHWCVCQLAGIALAVFFTVPTSAYGDSSGIEGYEEYYYTPQEQVIPRGYTYDPPNRRSSLTPEPVWRSMFPSIEQRRAVEERTFGVPGATEQEQRYWRSWDRRNRGQ